MIISLYNLMKFKYDPKERGVASADQLNNRREVCKRDTTEARFVMISHTAILVFAARFLGVSLETLLVTPAAQLLAVVSGFGVISAGLGYFISHAQERSMGALLSGRSLAHNFERAQFWSYNPEVPGMVAKFLGASTFLLLIGVLLLAWLGLTIDPAIADGTSDA